MSYDIIFVPIVPYKINGKCKKKINKWRYFNG